ncbi:MAG TPA: phosphate acyltransferase PlsX, partial [Flavobacteriales bacterium]|nr:phosphate acyltransferase PlsX [Flavobacteriales bacterium]
MKIGIDIMGGDFAPAATLKGAHAAFSELGEDCRLVLIGDEKKMRDGLKEIGADASNFDLIHASENIEMGEHPTKAFTKKPDSSIAVGFNLLKNNEIDVFCSVGNTGAMLVGSMYSVRAIPGVIRPCTTTIVPKEDGGIGIILDVGTNADSKPDVLYQFALLGSLYLKLVYKVENPKVGLLNIGEEEGKGNLLTQATHSLMKGTTDFNFVGNVEGRDLFNEKCDVLVCDGFTGNVVLKEMEAFYTMYRKRRLSDEFFDRFNYEIYGGTPILGINSNVILGHGISSPM